jgi:peptidyl-dipeptidase Dcp
MKKTVLVLLILGLAFTACGEKADMPGEETGANPFFSKYGTPFETPPFDLIKEEHYMPAFKEGMKRHKEEVAAIIENSEAPGFANTVEALERSGELLGRVSLVFFNMNSAHTNETIQRIAQEAAPLLSKHGDDIALDPDLFQRVKTVYGQKDSLDLNAEQSRLLENTYKAFVRGGANLDETSKARFREINEELSVVSLKFGENVLKETNAFEMVIEKEEDLAGLPRAVIAGAAEMAAERGQEGKWVFTIQKPSLIPFLQYSEKRDLREKIFKAYISVGDNGNEYDNKAGAARMAALRVERANLLGYPTHAHFVLEENMAKVPENVYKLLDQLWAPALKMAKKEAAQLQTTIDEEGGGFKLQPWDWWYYTEKVKKAKYALDDEILRPYFKLENVIDGAFGVATRLWGLQFKERPDITVYHPDVKCFEVLEADGTHIGILYADYFPRASKRGGAWMNNFREQSKTDGTKITPIIYNVGNFSKPTADRPSLVTFEEALTLFHEFGHALHGLLSDCTYESLSGTNVPRDFVELPSQIMEHWASHPDYLKEYAKHFETGEPIPQDLIDKMEKAGTFNQGFTSTEYLAASYLDMDWHTLTEPVEQDPAAFENKSLSRIGLIPEIVVRYRTPYFRHIFAGGYSAGYYSYDWSAVLDSDAFEAFKETSLFDQEKAQALRKYIFSAGNTDEPMTMFKNFRGREPRPEPLLRKRGFLQ